jgi:steroid delta-isomerase-like uncharacterized protein
MGIAAVQWERRIGVVAVVFRSGGEGMFAEVNKRIVGRVVRDILDRGELTAVDQLFAPDFHDHCPRPGCEPNRAGYRRGVAALRSAFPDLAHAIRQVVADDDTVVLHLTARGTHRGEFMGIPPTGQRVTIDGVVIFRLHGDRVVERWAIGDDFGLARQLVAAPPSVAAPRLN